MPTINIANSDILQQEGVALKRTPIKAPPPYYSSSFSVRLRAEEAIRDHYTPPPFIAFSRSYNDSACKV